MKKIFSEYGGVVVTVVAVVALIAFVTFMMSSNGSVAQAFSGLTMKFANSSHSLIDAAAGWHSPDDDEGGGAGSDEEEKNVLPISWNSMDVSENVSVVFQGMPFVKVSDAAPSMDALRDSAIQFTSSGTSLSIPCSSVEGLADVALAVYGDSLMIVVSVPAAGEYMGIVVEESGLYALNYAALGYSNIDFVIVSSCNHAVWGADDYCTTCGVYKYTDFTVMSDNLSKVGYTGEENENLVIPATFYDEEDGKWYRVTRIGESAFLGCTNLTNITIPDSVLSIGMFAFQACTSLTNFIIPDSVTSIDGSAFSGCTSLERITVSDNNAVYHSAGNCIIETASKSLVAGCIISTIPTDGSVTSIGTYAFYGCTNLTSIAIPDSVTSIGAFAFEGCTSLTSISIPDNVTSIGECAFLGCRSLADVAFGENSRLASIGQDAFFDCRGLTSIIIPDNVTSIGRSAFSGCTNLNTVVFGESSQLTNIGKRAFYKCNSLNSITFAGTMEQWNAVDKGSEWNTQVPATEVICSDGIIAL